MARHLPQSPKEWLKAALANYVANQEREPETGPKMAFALCYVAAHFVLDIISDDDAHDILAYYEDHLA